VNFDWQACRVSSLVAILAPELVVPDHGKPLAMDDGEQIKIGGSVNVRLKRNHHPVDRGTEKINA
jgi:hypothetical protein